MLVEAKVIYLDGEMPAETFKERMEIVGGFVPVDLKLYGYNREVLGDGEMPPLNTSDGERWLQAELERRQAQPRHFSTLSCASSQAQCRRKNPGRPSSSWSERFRAGGLLQIWLHHTGHDAGRGFGTKTREWEMEPSSA